MPIIIDPSLPEPTPPTVVTGPDGVLTATVDAANAGVLLVADFTAMSPQPTRARFYRNNPDGTTVLVRSGDPARAPGGTAVAYDDEAPLGVGVSWYAAPMATADSVEGAPCDAVALEVPAPAGGVNDPGTWAKCLDDPNLSRQIKVQSWPEFDYDQGVASTRPLGSSFPVADLTYPGGSATGTLTVLVADEAEETAVRAVFASGVVLTQSRPDYNRADRYWLATGVKVSRISPRVQVTYRSLAVDLQQVDRPDTAGQKLRIPGRSYADRLAAYPTFDTVPARTFLQALTG